jgi:protoporphyrinogen oxidase
MSKKNRVAVVGAGLAGLVAAYALSKDERVEVHLFEERDYVGGRVCSLPVNDVPVDFGGFIIYPWYEQFHRLIEQLGLEDELQRIPMKTIYYDLDGDHVYKTEKELDFPIKHTLLLYPKVALGVLSQDDMADPDLHRFQGRTIQEHFRKILGVQHETLYERYTDTVSQGYCYGAVNQYKMSFVAPIIRFQRLYGDISTAFYFKKGTGVLTHALREAIEHQGGVVHLNRSLVSLDGHSLTLNDGEFEADQVVLALPANHSVYHSLVASVEQGCAYTHFYTISVRASAVPDISGDKEWGAVFHRPEAHVPYQILSSINLASLYESSDVEGVVNFNVVVRDELVQDEVLDKENLFETLLPQLNVMYPDVEWKECIQLKHWPVTMPIAQEEFVAQVRALQGKDGHYFAGDFLGSPSMETAITTGVRAATQLLQDLS